jgi:LysR family transcriptional regulator, transcriptional activator of the cysJI operon
MLNLPDLNRMKVFYVVYAHKSLVSAAHSMNITRSAISQSLKLLEDELQTKLFIRNSKKVLPTETAHLLYRSLDPFFIELQAAVIQLETGKREPIGHLRIGAPQDFGSTHLTEVIVEFRKKHPQITFELVLATPVTLLEQLTGGTLDIAFVDNGDFHAKKYPVSIVTVMKEKFILVCSNRYFDEVVKRPNIQYEELKKFAFVDYMRHTPVAKMWIKHHFGKVPHELFAAFSAESVRAVIQATKGGLGVAVVPEHLVKADLKSGRLKAISATGPDLVNQITLARLLERPISAREKQFVEFYKEFAGRR